MSLNRLLLYQVQHLNWYISCLQTILDQNSDNWMVWKGMDTFTTPGLKAEAYLSPHRSPAQQ